MITIHHLQISQSERILWLCEELSLPYTLITHTRAPLAAPPSLKSIPGNTLGRAPFLVDETHNVRLGESAAIVEYIINTYGNGRLSIRPGQPGYADYLYWFHYANGNIQPTMLVSMFVDNSGTEAGGLTQMFADGRLKGMLDEVEGRLGVTGMYLVGEEFTAADVMSLYSLTTQRYFGPVGSKVSFGGYPNIVRWLERCSAREAYKRAMEKGDPEMKVLTGAEAPEHSLMAVGGSESDAWKKK